MKETKVMPKDFSAAVKDIKLAILQARARAARVSNVEALKLYFFVGGYVSKKTRAAKWGSGAIDALSDRLRIELPGLRGFSASSTKFMRLWYEAWSEWFAIRYLPSNELGHGTESMVAIELKMGDFHPGYLGQLNFYLSALDHLMKKPDENPTIGLLLCEKVNKPVVQLAVQGYSQPIGIATYQALKNIPQPYKALAPVIDGVRKVMVEYKSEMAAKADAKRSRNQKGSLA